MEDGDSGHREHSDSGTDRTGHYELHGCDDVRIEKRGSLHNGRLLFFIGAVSIKPVYSKKFGFIWNFAILFVPLTLGQGRLHLKNDNKSKFILHFIRFALPLHPIWLKQQ